MKKKKRNCVPIDRITGGCILIAHQNDIAFPNCNNVHVYVYVHGCNAKKGGGWIGSRGCNK